MTLMWDEYRDWLLDKVGFKDYELLKLPGREHSCYYPWNYELLMRKLHDIDFKWFLERDENRMKDGLALRYDFFDENEVDGGFIRPCSVLEMLVGLSLRLECDYIGDPGDPHPVDIFWQMICNLGLGNYFDTRFDSGRVEKIVDIWMSRRYDYDGKGGIFPLKGDTFDSREEEIWKLAMAYITENY